MANKQYLDKGGLEHAWSKIKSWIQTYLSSWKTTNFGTGTYNNTGSIINRGQMNNIGLINNSGTIAVNTLITIIDKSETTVISMDDSQLHMVNDDNRVNVNSSMGIAVLNNTQLYVVNHTTSDICACAIYISAGSSSSAASSEITHNIVAKRIKSNNLAAFGKGTSESAGAFIFWFTP